MDGWIATCRALRPISRNVLPGILSSSGNVIGAVRLEIKNPGRTSAMWRRETRRTHQSPPPQTSSNHRHSNRFGLDPPQAVRTIDIRTGLRWTFTWQDSSGSSHEAFLPHPTTEPLVRPLIPQPPVHNQRSGLTVSQDPV